jgi:hypothetical protein
MPMIQGQGTGTAGTGSGIQGGLTSGYTYAGAQANPMARAQSDDAGYAAAQGLGQHAGTGPATPQAQNLAGCAFCDTAEAALTKYWYVVVVGILVAVFLVAGRK